MASSTQNTDKTTVPGTKSTILAAISSDLRAEIAAEAGRILPADEAHTLPATWYTDANFHHLDQQLIFSNSWQYAGYEKQAANPGDWFLAEVAGKPLIIVRGNDKKLRAFFNVCRHRGGPLATESGSGRVLQCRYHGWTYTLTGQLAGAPHCGNLKHFDKKDCHLDEVQLDAWEGLLFANLAAAPDHSLEDLFSGVRERLLNNPLPAKKFHRRIVYEVACNWKIYMDNYLEGYHVPFVHPGLNDVLNFDQYTTEIRPWHILQHSPFEASGADNPYKANKGDEAVYVCAWPNFMLNCTPGRVQLNLVLPKGPGSTAVIFDYFYDDPESPAATNAIARDIEFSDVVQAEDIAICEQVQRGLQSGSYGQGRICATYEHGLHHFQNLVRKAYSGA